MPRVLADEDRRAAESRFEGLQAPSTREKALLVENAIRGQEHLAMHVHDLVRRRRHGKVQCRIIIRPARIFVKPEHDIDGRAQRPRSGAPSIRDALRERFRIEGEFVYGAFEKIARQRRFGENDEIVGLDVGGELREDRLHFGHIRHDVAFARLALDDRDFHTMLRRRRARRKLRARHRSERRCLPPDR